MKFWKFSDGYLCKIRRMAWINGVPTETFLSETEKKEIYHSILNSQFHY